MCGAAGLAPGQSGRGEKRPVLDDNKIGLFIRMRDPARLTLLVFTRTVSLAGHMYTVQLFRSYHVCSVKYSLPLASVSHSSMFASSFCLLVAVLPF